MKLGDLVIIRTGLVLSRKEVKPSEADYKYRALNLKCVTNDGKIIQSEVDDYYTNDNLKREYFTYANDILVRLSTPYTILMIKKTDENLLIPSHFAIIRTGDYIDSNYLCWWLSKNRKQFFRFASGGTLMGTISSGYIADMIFEPLEIENQHKIGRIHELAIREQQLLAALSESKKKLIEATLIKFDSSKGEMVL